MKKAVLITMMVMFFTSVSFASETETNPNNSREFVATSTVSPFIKGIVNGDLKFVEKMIEFGIDVNQESGKTGMTPLMYAARYNKTAIIEMLVKEGAEVKIKSKQGFSAKKYAELSNAKDAMALLEKL